MEKYVIDGWGTFRFKETEEQFLDNEKDFYSYYIKLTILLSGVGYFLVSIADYNSHGLASPFWIASSSRLFFLFVCVVKFIAIKRGVAVRTTIRLMFVNIVLNVTLLSWLIYTLNPDRTLEPIDEITMPVILLMTLILAQIPLKFLFSAAIYALTLYIFLLVWHFNVGGTYLINFTTMVVALVSIGLFLGRFLNASRRKEYAHRKEVEHLNKVLVDEMEERNQTKIELERVFKELKDSLRYAQSLQMTLMPPTSMLEEYFPDSFVLFKPKEEVSGDFYWVHNVGDKTIVVVADCTGHGIPGAFMSIFGLTLLKMIVKQRERVGVDLDAAMVLSELQSEVIDSMKTSDEARERRDGMDISLCIIDKKQRKLQFAGAFSDLWVVSNHDRLTKIKGVKMPIGIYVAKHEFVNHEVSLEQDDAIYLFTDGYKDQFGGQFGKRFMTKNLESLVVSIQDKRMKQQREYLYSMFKKWKYGYSQVDDMLIIGIRF